MKRYKVILHPDAEKDIESSFQWGCRAWGQELARAWVRLLRNTITQRLTSMPPGCPIAPESDELGTSVRQLIVDRYRVLFIIEKRTVTILHVRALMFLSLAGNSYHGVRLVKSALIYRNEPGSASST